jgi:hypothetical protein
VEEDFRTEAAILRWPLATERRRTVLTVAVWGISIATVYAQAVFQRTTATTVDYGIIFVICLLGGAVSIELGKAIGSYLVAIIIGMTILFFLAATPILDGTIPSPGNQFFLSLWIGIIFRLIFPFQFIAFLMASIIGAIIGEHYFY